MSGAEIFGIIAALPPLIALLHTRFEETVEAVSKYKNRKNLISKLQQDMNVARQRILLDATEVEIIASQWEREMKIRDEMKERETNNPGTGFTGFFGSNAEKAKQFRMQEEETYLNSFPLRIHLLHTDLNNAYEALKETTKQLELYRRRFDTMHKNPFLRPFFRVFYAGKFATIGCDKLVNAHSSVQDLTNVWRMSGMMMVEQLNGQVIRRMDGKHTEHFQGTSAVEVVIELRRRIEEGVESASPARQIDMALMGDSDSYVALQDEDDKAIGIWRPDTATVSPEFKNSIVDARPWNHDDEYRQVDIVKRIARLLSGNVHFNPVTFEADPHSGGFLKCKGFVQRQIRPRSRSEFGKPTTDARRLELIFEIPVGYIDQPRTLRAMLVDEFQHSISQRLALCHKLAGIMFLLQTSRIVHKAIRPDSILMLEPSYLSESERYPHGLGEPFLLGWGDARAETDETRKVPYWEKVHERSYQFAYRHPRDAGESRYDEFRNLDDIYAFGVTLLEIGIWKSFFVFDKAERRFLNNRGAVDLLNDKNYHKDFNEMCAAHKDAARKELPKTMGNVFSEIVLDCLMSLEPPFKFGKPFDSKEGTVVSQKFMELVINKLRKLVDHV